MPDGLTPEDRKWIDWRMNWLLSEFSENLLFDAVVALPDDAEFSYSRSREREEADEVGRREAGVHLTGRRSDLDSSDSIRSTPEWAEKLCHRLCEWMALDQSSVHLKIEAPQENSSQYIGDREFDVYLSEENLDDVPQAIARLAHQLGLIHLSGFGRIPSDAKDRSLLADLAGVFFGLGIVSANAAAAQLSSTNARTVQNSMTVPMYGYALALFAHIRDEKKPTWANELHQNARQVFDESQEFLDDNGVLDAPQNIDQTYFNQYATQRLSSSKYSRNTSEEEAVSAGSRIDFDRSADEVDAEFDQAGYASETSYTPDTSNDRVGEELDRNHSSQDRAPENEKESWKDQESSPNSRYCVNCGAIRLEGHDVCERCRSAREHNRAALKAELARHDERTWIFQFAILVAVVAFILIAVAAVSTGL